MEKSKSSALNRLYGKRSPANGFSLIEVTIAIGIVAFAFITVFGLIPTGMNIFRQSINRAVTSQIAQRVINDCQQSDFSELLKDANNNTITGTGATGLKATRYFDEQANELVSTNGVAPKGAIYHVLTRIMPQTFLPVVGTSTGVSLATVTVQIASNPGNQKLAMSTDSTSDASKPLRNLWTGATSTNPTAKGVIPTVLYSALVAKNQ